MEDLPLGRIAALVPEFAVKDLPLGQHTDDDDDVLCKRMLTKFWTHWGTGSSAAATLKIAELVIQA